MRSCSDDVLTIDVARAAAARRRGPRHGRVPRLAAARPLLRRPVGRGPDAALAPLDAGPDARDALLGARSGTSPTTAPRTRWPSRWTRASSPWPRAALSSRVDERGRPPHRRRGRSTSRTRSYLITLVAGELAEGELPGARAAAGRDRRREPAGRARRRCAPPTTCWRCSRELGRAAPTPTPSTRRCLVAGLHGRRHGEHLRHHADRDAALADERRQDSTHDARASSRTRLAHQWFGDLLTCRDWAHLWLNEGFATYAEMLWVLHRDARRGRARALALGWQRADGRLPARRAPSVLAAGCDDPDELFDDRPLRAAPPAASALLAELLGDEVLHRGVRRYVARARGARRHHRRPARRLEAASRPRPRAPSSRSGSTAPAAPRCRCASPRAATSAPLLAVAADAGRATAGGAVFHLPVHVAWSRGGVEQRRPRWRSTQPREELSLAGEGPLDWVHFDARCVVLGRRGPRAVGGGMAHRSCRPRATA